MSAKFLSELKTSKECLDHCTKDNVRRWKLDTPLIYQTDLLPFPIYIHAGVSTDYASYWGREGQAASVIHDFLYSNHSLYRAKFSYNGIISNYLASSDWVVNSQIIEEKVKIGKLKADRIFYEAMGVTNDPPSNFRKWAMWQAVVWAGWLAWIRSGKSRKQ